MKKAGVLMPITALPSAYGCGDFGKEAYHFVDLMYEAGVTLWQILPLNPLGYGNSPYQPYSSYAMDDIYLSLERLYEAGLLHALPKPLKKEKQVDYEAVRAYRMPYLKEAFSNFKPDLNYANFSYQEWMRQYAIFMTLKKKNGMREWTEWEEEEKNQPLNGSLDLKPLEEDILFEIFLQYELFLQWKDLKQYANDHEIEIMGDMPFYVGLDSADVWANRSNFLLDDDGRPTFIAGVPPDYFSATGQRWGNPIYNWEAMEEDGFSFWVDRLSYVGKMMDIVRVDHFRAFDTYWKIPASCPTAMEGEWIEAPGYALFDTLFKKNPELHIVAEDLGDLRQEVLELRDHYNFKGMRVMQFQFFPGNIKDETENLLIYTGTHDNDTLLSWYRNSTKEEQNAMRKHLRNLGFHEGTFSKNVIAYAMSLAGEFVIVPIFDLLNLDGSARINTPGTVGAPNWMFKLTSWKAVENRIDWLKQIVERFDRQRKS